MVPYSSFFLSQHYSHFFPFLYRLIFPVRCPLFFSCKQAGLDTGWSALPPVHFLLLSPFFTLDWIPATLLRLTKSAKPSVSRSRVSRRLAPLTSFPLVFPPPVFLSSRSRFVPPGGCDSSLKGPPVHPVSHSVSFSPSPPASFWALSRKCR